MLVRDQLRGEIEQTLDKRAALVTSGPLSIRTGPGGSRVLEIPYRGFEQGDVFLQAVDAEGRIAKPDPRQVAFPVSDAIKQAAAAGGDAFFTDAVIKGAHFRQLVVPVGDGYVLQLVRPLEEVDRLLERIGLVLVLVSLGGIAAAAAFGALVARTALRPVKQLTREAEVVAENAHLSRRIGLQGDDELARLGWSFDTSSAALDDVRSASSVSSSPTPRTSSGNAIDEHPDQRRGTRAQERSRARGARGTARRPRRAAG